ncbi:MAG TPA: hypothetical protein VHY37_13080 [Tepidisphaeraceae bacterium]|jgi:hypothetical protein|nr:hypothetical protein [Tepidisphaeraceae bacterium]
MKRITLFPAAVLAAVAGLGVAQASAQATHKSTQPTTLPSDETPPGPSGMSAQEMLNQMLRADSGAGAKPLQPLPEGPNPNAAATAGSVTTPILPGAARTSGAPTTQPSAVAGLREGSYIVNRTGHLEREDGNTLLILDPLPTDKHPISLLVLPNLKRLAMEQAVASTSRTLTFRNINGTVTEYHGKNWVLLTLDPSVDSYPSNPMAPPSPPPQTPSPPTPAQPTRSMSPEDVLSNMLRPPASGGPGTVQSLPSPADGSGMNAATGVGAVAPNAPQLSLLREGTFIFDRVGRLTKSPDGSRSEFTFETDGRTMEDPPLILMPCVKTATMEVAVNATNQDLKFRVTGLVTEYRGRNYLLPDRVVVIPDATQQF